MVADVPGDGKSAKDIRKKLENLYTLDGAMQKKRTEEARNTVSNIMAESEKISTSVLESLLPSEKKFFLKKTTELLNFLKKTIFVLVVHIVQHNHVSSYAKWFTH